MTDPALLFVKPKSISASDKKRCSQAGIVVIEIDDPSSVKFVRAGTEMSSTAMLCAAMSAMLETTGGTTQQMQNKFALKIATAVIDANPLIAKPS